MSKRVERWQTQDGKLWATEENAAKHEKELKALENLDDVWYNRCIESQEDLLDFLDEHQSVIKAIMATKE